MSLDHQITQLEAAFEKFLAEGRAVSLEQFVKLPFAVKKLTRARASEIAGLANEISNELSNIKLHGELPIALMSQDKYEFYYDRYMPNHNNIEELASDDPEFMLELDKLFQDGFEIHNNLREVDPVQREAKALLDEILDLMVTSDQLSLDASEYDRVYLEKSYEFIASKYFRPIELSERAEKLVLITANRDAEDFPVYIRARAKEVAETFIHGRFLSAIASSRALLEFSLADRAKVIGFEPYSTRDPEKLMRLDDMILNTITLCPQLKEDLEMIQREGNEVLHPPKNKKVRRLLPSEHLRLKLQVQHYQAGRVLRWDKHTSI